MGVMERYTKEDVLTAIAILILFITALSTFTLYSLLVLLAIILLLIAWYYRSWRALAASPAAMDHPEILSPEGARMIYSPGTGAVRYIPWLFFSRISSLWGRFVSFTSGPEVTIDIAKVSPVEKEMNDDEGCEKETRTIMEVYPLGSCNPQEFLTSQTTGRKDPKEHDTGDEWRNERKQAQNIQNGIDGGFFHPLSVDLMGRSSW
jgi:hypothetical protein